jgi:hypothetical protein
MMKHNIYIIVIVITVIAICVLDFYERSLNLSASLDLKISEKSGIQKTSTILPCLNMKARLCIYFSHLFRSA